MSDALLVKAIEQYESVAETHGELSKERTQALDYYLGNPLGNEVDGRSQVISRDVWDTVEWIKPQLADIFCGGDEVVLFTPRGPEDMQAAEQESEFVNYIITQKNNWFETWYCWSHDALLQKVGYVKAYWDDSEDITKEKYKGLTEDEAVLLFQDEGVEPVAAERSEAGWDIEVQRTHSYGCVRLVNVAPENVRVDPNARNLNLQDPSCNFSEHCEQKTISQLRLEGFDVDDDLSDSGSTSNAWEEERRQDPSTLRSDGSENTDPSMRKVWVRECWIRYDEDGDGKAELRHVIIVGTTILLNEEAENSLLVALCPTPLPHQHTGLSLADAVKDLQLIKTALLRGSLDNVYLANNGRHAVDESLVNLDDMLVSRPGGLVRTKGDPRMAIMPLTHSTTGDVAVPMMEYVDRVASKRTGVSEAQQGLDPNALNNNAGAHANSAMMTAAMQRIKFIARIFAETGVKCLFQLVHALTLKHSRKAEMIRLRNQWIPVDPRQWKKRADMQISVGLGAGDKMQQIVFLEGVLQKQILALQAGLTSPPKVYNALKRLTQAGGFKDPNEFWDDPSTKPPMPPAPNPEVVKEQMKGQVAVQVEQMKGQVSLQQEQQRAQLKLQELRATLELQAANDARDAEREQIKAQYEAQLEAQRLEIDKWKTQVQAQVTQYTTDANNETKIQIAEMQARVQVHSQDQQAEAQDRQSAIQAQEADKGRMHDEKMADKTHEHTKEQAKEQARAQPKPADSSKDIAALEKTVQEVIKGQKQLEETMRKPKKILRDKDGRVIGAAIED
jgi:hypothetical protein